MSTIPKLAIGLSAAMLLAGAAGAQSSPEAGQPGPAAGAGGDFATYDADQSGSLDAAEFSSWYQANHQTDKDGKPVSADELSRKATQAFSQADADHDQRVSQAELAGAPAG
ncbi:MAG: hypothetical protein BGP16_17340 [Sphingobium sp. 66-54]|nr:MAG: hypothetical protein BGP16_17340 [Sphingobium sp. 66-54]